MIEHTTWMYKTNTTENYRPFLNDILSSYNWENGSIVHLNGDDYFLNVYGTYYFTHNSYIKIYNNGNYFYPRIDIVTSGQSTTVFSAGDGYWTTSVATTNKGICICVFAGPRDNNRDPYFYNLYVGEITLLDGTTTKGCIYVNDDNSYIVATDKGISKESAFVANINNTRKAYLAPATDSTNGGIFKDIYMMFSSPVQYNKMKIADTGTKYLCGKAMCLAD